MPTPSSRLGLLVPARADQFVTADLETNLDKLDDYPGIYVCTSTSRPAWGAAQVGMLISETDTGLTWRWMGTATGWVRTGPKGLMSRNTSGTNLSTTSTSFVNLLATSLVTWPAGARTAQITVTFNYGFNNTTGLLTIGVARGIVNNSGLIQAWQWAGDNDGSSGTGTKGAGTSLTCYDANLGPGTYQWSLQLRACGAYGQNAGGSAVLAATGAGSITITVTEI